MTIWTPTLATTNKPIYKKLADAIEQAIQNGDLKFEQKLPPQRRLADLLQVTIGTITRAYNEAERRGCVIAKVGSGTFVKTPQLNNYLSQSPISNKYDLRSANAPMGAQSEMLSIGLRELADQHGNLNNCLTYQAEDGLLAQRQQLVDWLIQRNVNCTQENVLFTNGGQHGIFLTLQAYCRAGDTVLAEGLCFQGINIACQQQQLRCIGLTIDDDGIVPAALAAAIKQSNPRILYLTAQLQNPTCSQMSLARKKEILALCQLHDILIIEDDVQFLPWQDKLPSFYQLDPQITVYISSFSKSFSGGIRLGYIIANIALKTKIKLALRANCWTLSPLIIELVCHWLTNGKMAALEQWLSNEMAARHRIVEQQLSDFSLTFHPHGYNTWLTLPEQWRAVDFVKYAQDNDVLVRAAESYAIGKFSAPQNIRLCICAPKDRVELKNALIILKRCLNKDNVSTAAVL